MASIGLRTEALPLTAHAQGMSSFFIILIPKGNGKPMKNPNGAVISMLNIIFKLRFNEINKSIIKSSENI